MTTVNGIRNFESAKRPVSGVSHRSVLWIGIGAANVRCWWKADMTVVR